MNKKILSRAIFFCIITIVIASIPIDSLSTIRNAKVFLTTPWFLLIALFLFFIQEGINPLQAKLALNCIKEKSNYFSLLKLMLFSTSVNSTVPLPAGVPLRVFLQKKLLNIPYNKSTMGIIIETVIGYGTSAFFISITVPIFLQKKIVIGDIIDQYDGHIYLGVIILFFLIPIAVFIWKKDKIIFFFKEFLVLIGEVRCRLYLILMTMFSITSLFLSSGRMMTILYSFDKQSNIGVILSIMLLSYFAGVISLLPMGIGARDLSLTTLLVLIDIPLPIALATAAIDRVFISLPYLVGAGLCSHSFKGYLIKNKNKVIFSLKESNDE